MKRSLLGLVAGASLLSARSPGLDLYTLPNARDCVTRCARDKEGGAVRPSCPFRKEVIVLLLNGEDEPEITGLLAGKGVSLNTFLASAEAGKFALVHIFPASKLQTGQMRSLDGKLHEVAYGPQGPSQTGFCSVDGRVGGSTRWQGSRGEKAASP